MLANMERKEHSSLLVKMYISAVTMENCMEVSQNPKTKPPLPGWRGKDMRSACRRDTCTPAFTRTCSQRLRHGHLAPVQGSVASAHSGTDQAGQNDIPSSQENGWTGRHRAAWNRSDTEGQCCASKLTEMSWRWHRTHRESEGVGRREDSRRSGWRGSGRSGGPRVPHVTIAGSRAIAALAVC